MVIPSNSHLNSWTKRFEVPAVGATTLNQLGTLDSKDLIQADTSLAPKAPEIQKAKPI
jgi:hypothetical protein